MGGDELAVRSFVCSLLWAGVQRTLCWNLYIGPMCQPRERELNHICLFRLTRQHGCNFDATNQGISNGHSLKRTLSNPLTCPGINSLFITCIGIIRNNSLVGWCARAEARTLATERVMLYCTWRPSVQTTQPHG